MPFDINGAFTKLKTFANSGNITPAEVNAALDDIGNQVGANFVAGDLKWTARSGPTAGWLVCDGSAVSRSGATANLFIAVGTTYGVGDGSSTFNLPDYRDRVPVGASATIARGATGGAKTHVLSTAELPAHAHVMQGGAEGVAAWPQTDSAGYVFLGENVVATLGAGGVSGNTNNAGSGTAHSSMQPYIGAHCLIKL